jgi:hypothetical protein
METRVAAETPETYPWWSTLFGLPKPKVTTSAPLRLSSNTQGNARYLPREFLLGSSIKGRQGQARDLL